MRRASGVRCAMRFDTRRRGLGLGCVGVCFVLACRVRWSWLLVSDRGGCGRRGVTRASADEESDVCVLGDRVLDDGVSGGRVRNPDARELCAKFC